PPRQAGQPRLALRDAGLRPPRTPAAGPAPQRSSGQKYAC
ncbi:unnamed protein product, partial [Tetraodon nigroviridis]